MIYGKGQPKLFLHINLKCVFSSLKDRVIEMLLCAKMGRPITIGLICGPEKKFVSNAACRTTGSECRPSARVPSATCDVAVAPPLPPHTHTHTTRPLYLAGCCCVSGIFYIAFDNKVVFTLVCCLILALLTPAGRRARHGSL